MIGFIQSFMFRDADMKRALAFAVLIMLLAGCKPGEEKAIELAKKEIALDLKDPESAKFRFTRMAKSNERGDGAVLAMVCGQVNAKNTFGAYSGYRHFLIILSMESKSLFNKGVTYKVERKLIEVENSKEDLTQYIEVCGQDN